MAENKKTVIKVVETPQCCFITDCDATSGYDYDYHQSKIKDMYFDGAKPDTTFAKNWLKIKQVPKSVEEVSPPKYINERYELKDREMANDKLPAVIPYEDRDKYPGSIIENLYRYDNDVVPGSLVPADVDFQIIMTLSECAEPSFEFEAIGKFGWDEKTYTIKSKNLRHQLIDKIIFPEVYLPNRPCSITSKQVYDITRQYVLSHIDPAVARITSNYDFCFTVKKIIPKTTPETITYQNIFARTKKERNKVKTSVQNYTEHVIFQMTHDQSNYQGYTAISAIFANSEAELQEKMDEWLSALITIINMPIQECPHCKGTGLLGEVEKSNHKILSDISARDVTKS